MYSYNTQNWQGSNVIPTKNRPPAPLALALADLAYSGPQADFDPADYVIPLKGVRVG
ncbi:hypothetical protein KM908_14360 [Alkalihalobacillus clausii]|uniref:hypothetical protein n=1 Tax=Shouchella clausii TaxID=79880 RepID=UPI001C211ABC|nr:hypothetical protein [Shouchella clausii]MBU8597325.1 hypothetical protein [Shouchella clausii]